MGIGKTLKKAARTVTKPLAELGSEIPGGDFIIPAALAAIPGVGPALAAGYVGLNSYGNTGKFLPSLAAAGASYAGGKIAGNVLGDAGGTIGSNIGSAANAIGGEGASNSLATALARTGANVAPGSFTSNFLSTPVSNIVGNAVGTSLASSLAGTNAENPQGPSPFTPQRQAEKSAPSSLQGIGSLNQNQQSSNIATQGVYGSGLGPEENDYFLNLVNRRLVDDSGKVGDISEINPIENSYLGNIGLGGFKNARNLLEAISKWKMA